MRDMGRRVNSGSRGFTRALLGVAGFIGFRVGSSVHSQRSLSLLSFALVHPCAPKGRRVQSGSRRFTGMGLEVVGFIRSRVG